MPKRWATAINYTVGALLILAAMGFVGWLEGSLT